MALRVVPIAVAILVAACDGLPTLTEADLLGTFDLVRVDGRELPAELWEDSGQSGVLHHEELEFLPAGRVVRSYRFVLTYLPTGEEVVSDVTFESEYRIRGSTVEIGRFEPCPPNALCLPNDVGMVRNGRLELQSWRWSGATAIYRAR